MANLDSITSQDWDELRKKVNAFTNAFDYLDAKRLRRADPRWVRFLRRLGVEVTR